MTYSRTFCSTLALSLTALCLPTLAFGACQEVRDRIAQNIESNGVEPMGYSLQVIPTSDADQAEGQIVGHCDNNQYQIVYQRHYRTSSAETMEDASAQEDEIDGTSSADTQAPPAETPETSAELMNAPETPAVDQTDDENTSDSRRVETSDMPVSTESSNN